MLKRKPVLEGSIPWHQLRALSEPKKKRRILRNTKKPKELSWSKYVEEILQESAYAVPGLPIAKERLELMIAYDPLS